MGIKVKETTPQQIEELRDRFNRKYSSTPPAAPFHPTDIDRIRNDHLWLQRFLEMHDLDMETSFTKLWETCTWRQSYGANDLEESQLNQEYLKEGSVFVHSNDVDGKPLLIFRVKLHSKSKNLDELIRIVVYWVERTQREQHLTQLTIFFDMAGTGLATMDLDFVKRIVETFKQYYPNTLNYILVFELAWVLNAAFKVIKALLPPKAVEILKMISKKDINQYITKDNCLASWGGEDNYEFSFVPEAKKVISKPVAANTGDDEQIDKKVTFVDSAPVVLKETNINKMHTTSEGMLHINPKDFVNFNSKNAEATMSIKSIATSAVTYKIQTTSPEKFRVRPRCGIIQPNQEATINIWLKSEHKLSDDSKDKFLVMAMVAPGGECSGADVTELWRSKSPTSADVEQHRLVCRFDENKSKAQLDCASKSSKASVDCSKKSGAGVDPATAMERQLAFTQNLQYVTLALLFLLFAGFGFLMYQQLGQHASTCPKATAYSCAKRK
ncbi:motile sperm domain-containing protein 2 isoform X1 [Drosophila sechellia]|uniref:GM14735 n=1 Tax=Drosophila sechellia TaxID=7238 RepID=B4HUL4_DROSE|nr:motile sperm domain-containing protein 2 isoform X1 [Drosophila sechellia]EDW50635.1 GM14735 [Drosophila sechellia]